MLEVTTTRVTLPELLTLCDRILVLCEGRITGEFTIDGDIKIRPADLYVSSGHRQPGVVLVGDAFETTCPVTGTGTDKVFTDVERLCNVHIPAWLASDGMEQSKIEAFYDDPVKQACDAWSSRRVSVIAVAPGLTLIVERLAARREHLSLLPSD